MKLVADSAIPFLKGVFEPYARTLYKPGAEIRREDLADADALIVRTRTRCDGRLLEGTPVKMIAVSAIGTDNVDMPWCKEHGIFVQNAPGSNSGGVMNYVFSALYGAAARKSIPLKGATMGILGAGHCGTRVGDVARHLGFKVLLYDPIREQAEGPGQFCTLDYLLENSDVVSLHLPINDSTRGMAGTAFFDRMKLGAFFINTARGELVVEDALMAAIPRLGPVILDRGSGGTGGREAGSLRPHPGAEGLAFPVQLSYIHGRFHVPDGSRQFRAAPGGLPLQKRILYLLEL